jgi:hypothetical protein
MTDDPGYETVSADELARLRRIEDAARKLLDTWPSGRSASPLLAAMAELRAALKAPPS